MKRDRLGRQTACIASFPPHSCGGLIEAMSSPAHLTLYPSFPPHSCGGLIEATSRCRRMSASRVVFPRIRAGASLKRKPCGTASRASSGFSPAFVRGPH